MIRSTIARALVALGMNFGVPKAPHVDVADLLGRAVEAKRSRSRLGTSKPRKPAGKRCPLCGPRGWHERSRHGGWR